MLKDVQIIQSTGIPIYSYREDEETESSVIQAGFFTAITAFASEINVGGIKQIIFEDLTFLLRKSPDYLFIFGTDDPDTTSLVKALLQTSDNFLNNVADTEDLSEIDQYLSRFNQELTDMSLIGDNEQYNPSQFKSKMQNYLFSAVGYTPGQCNIGKKERQRRLLIGLGSFLLSFVLLMLFDYFDIDKIYRLFLIIPNMGGFIGLYQYFFRFCVANAMMSRYVME
jgi:hypothetical protein